MLLLTFFHGAEFLNVFVNGFVMVQRISACLNSFHGSGIKIKWVDIPLQRLSALSVLKSRVRLT